MRNYVTIFCVLMVIIIGAGSCKKSGVNQNLDPNGQKRYDFMSTKVGTYWTYGSRSGVSYTRYARDRDSIKNGLKYSYFERKDTAAGNLLPEYFGKNNNLYITLLDLDGTRTSYLPYVFWIDSAYKGRTWDNTGKVYHPLSGNVDVLIESVQSDDSLNMTIGSNVFTKVVHVHSDIKATLINTKVGTLDIWFIKGLGVIREEANINVFGAFTQTHTDSLIDYKIVE